MAALFGNKTPNQNISERDLLTAKYHNGRHNLLLVVLFTAINLVMLFTNSGRYFLFSAYVPYLIGGVAMYSCGKYPAEMYDGDMADYEFFDTSFLVVACIIAVVIVGVYLLCWFMAKKPRVGFMVFGLVLFIVDTAVMIFNCAGFLSEMILDVVFHGWVLISLINGILAYNKLKKLPPEEIVAEPEAVPEAQPVTTLNGETIE